MGNNKKGSGNYKPNTYVKKQNNIVTKPNFYNKKEEPKIVVPPVKVNKKRKTVQKFSKTSNDFVATWESLINILPPSIQSLFSDTFATPYDVTKRMAEISLIFTPDLISRENVLWEFKISADKVLIKTDKFISFGWTIKSEKNTEGTYNITYIFEIYVIGNDDFELERKINNAGYTLVSNVPKKAAPKKQQYKPEFNKQQNKSSYTTKNSNKSSSNNGVYNKNKNQRKEVK